MSGRSQQNGAPPRPIEFYNIPARRLPPGVDGPGILGSYPQGMMVPPPPRPQFYGQQGMSQTPPPSFRGEQQQQQHTRRAISTTPPFSNAAHFQGQGFSYDAPYETGFYVHHQNFYPGPENYYRPPFHSRENHQHQHQYVLRHQQQQGQQQDQGNNNNNDNQLNMKMSQSQSIPSIKSEPEPTNDLVNRNAADEFRKRVQEVAKVKESAPVLATRMNPSKEKKAFDFKKSSTLMVKVTESDSDDDDVFDKNENPDNFNVKKEVEEVEVKEEQNGLDSDSDDSSIVLLKYDDEDEDEDEELIMLGAKEQQVYQPEPQKSDETKAVLDIKAESEQGREDVAARASVNFNGDPDNKDYSNGIQYRITDAKPSLLVLKKKINEYVANWKKMKGEALEKIEERLKEIHDILDDDKMIEDFHSNSRP